jgi:2-C-methyl-D-erythritol 2,4-cyclodiphosphate synthase
MKTKIRVGIGYDVHALVENRKLILGGVEIPFPKGLSGWSDADVLIHAVMDSLLGAASLGDIGTQFPPGDPEYENISSLDLLVRVKNLIDKEGWRIGNIDVMIMAEAPRLKPHIPKMASNIARTLSLETLDINIKAGTNEGLGFLGRGEGIAAQAVTLLEFKE